MLKDRFQFIVNKVSRCDLQFLRLRSVNKSVRQEPPAVCIAPTNCKRRLSERLSWLHHVEVLSDVIEWQLAARLISALTSWHFTVPYATMRRPSNDVFETGLRISDFVTNSGDQDFHCSIKTIENSIMNFIYSLQIANLTNFVSSQNFLRCRQLSSPSPSSSVSTSPRNLRSRLLRTR